MALFADYEDPQTTALAISLTRTMFPTVLFSGVAFSLVGVLQAQDHFTAPALMSALSNLVIIAYFLFLDQSMGIYGLALAYLLGWFLQGVIQVPPLRRLGYQYRPGLDFRSPGMKKVFALMGPVMVSTWVQPTIWSSIPDSVPGYTGGRVCPLWSIPPTCIWLLPVPLSCRSPM